MPAFTQLFIGANGVSGDDFERKLYLIRKHATHQLRGDHKLRERQQFYVCSLSTKVIVYKACSPREQVFPFYPDLGDARFESHLAMVHSRFSTNTFPSWDRAQPNRFMSHNGEINTLLGNQNAMNARQGLINSPFVRCRSRKTVPHRRGRLLGLRNLRQCSGVLVRWAGASCKKRC